MDKIYVVFWTQGGNTQAMAEAIGEGIREAGKEAEVVFVTGANLDELKAAPKFALGCPAMGAEVLRHRTRMACQSAENLVYSWQTHKVSESK